MVTVPSLPTSKERSERKPQPVVYLERGGTYNVMCLFTNGGGFEPHLISTHILDYSRVIVVLPTKEGCLF